MEIEKILNYAHYGAVAKSENFKKRFNHSKNPVKREILERVYKRCEDDRLKIEKMIKERKEG